VKEGWTKMQRKTSFIIFTLFRLLVRRSNQGHMMELLSRTRESNVYKILVEKYLGRTLHYIYIYRHIIIIIGIQPLGRSGQRPEFSQATGMALVRCILGKFLGVAYRHIWGIILKGPKIYRT